MNSGNWDVPVTFETRKFGAYLTISSTAEAARVLLEHWPIEKGKALTRAKAACLAALQGLETPENARKAFLKAAEAAGVFVRPRNAKTPPSP